MITVYPNPVTDKLKILTSLQIKDIEVTDITGRQVYTAASKTLDCKSIANGIYFIKATTEKGIEIRKFVKE